MTTNHINQHGPIIDVYYPTPCYLFLCSGSRLEGPLSVRHLPLVLRGCPGVCDLAKNIGESMAARQGGKETCCIRLPERWNIYNENYGTFGFGAYRFSLCLVGDAYQLMDMAVHDCFFHEGTMVPFDG